MLTSILTKLAKTLSPGRDISMENIGGRYFLHYGDSISPKNYLLDGTYSYDEVVKLNALTTYSSSFGYCYELGPVAFIGVPNPACIQKNGYFKYKIHAYGTPYDNESEVYFTLYTDEEAKQIGNYTVYGLNGLEKISSQVHISQLNYIFDSRYDAKKAFNPKVFDMDCQLKGSYSYLKAKVLATGTTLKKEGYSGQDHPIIFAIVGNSKPVGIINMWPSDIALVRGFRDVWEYGKEEPEVQAITCLTQDEAFEIKDFTLSVYNYASSGVGKDKYPIKRYDRTLDPRFNFQLPNGSDYRLVEHTELFR